MKNEILQGVSRKDWTKGDIVHVVRNELGDWTQDRCNYEPQKWGNWDTNECAQLSSINSVETQCNYLKRTGQFSSEALKWFTDNGYFDENGRFDFSERFTAILAGCSINGSSQWWAWQSMKTFGLLPWKDFHYSVEQAQKFSTQQAMGADYYDEAQITPVMRDKALQALKWINIEYEWLRNQGKNAGDFTGDFLTELKQSPIGLGVPICGSGWNSTNPPACTLNTAHHAVMCYKLGSKVIWDHYQPATKELPDDYTVFLAIKGVVTASPINNFKHTFYIDLKYGDGLNDGKTFEVAQLQTALMSLGFRIPALEGNDGAKGYFGTQTKSALFEFQKKYVSPVSWTNWLAVWTGLGRYCYSLTRQALNRIFS